MKLKIRYKFRYKVKAKDEVRYKVKIQDKFRYNEEMYLEEKQYNYRKEKTEGYG